MAKVTLITSREIFLRFDLIEDDGGLCSNVSKIEPPSDKYKAVFLNKNEDGKTGIINHIIKDLDEDTAVNYDNCDKSDIDAVAEFIKPYGCDLGDFVPGVFKYGCGDSFYYFAKEYPYFNDRSVAKYEYLDALLEMIFKDLEHVAVEEFKIFSHDRDWGVQGNKVSVPKNEAMNEYSYISRFFDDYKGQAMVFQHSDNYFDEIVNMLPESLRKN